MTFLFVQEPPPSRHQAIKRFQAADIFIAEADPASNLCPTCLSKIGPGVDWCCYPDLRQIASCARLDQPEQIRDARLLISKNLALRIAERTGVSEEWLLSDPPDDAGIPDRKSGVWDPQLLLDPLVLGDYDFRNALPMAPHLVLQLALAIVETGCAQAIQKNDHTLLVRVMDLIKREIDLHDPQLLSTLGTKLAQPAYADALQLWVLARLAANQRQAGRGSPNIQPGA